MKGEKQRREDKEEKQRQDYKRSVDKKFKDSLPKGNPRAWEKKKKPPGDELDRLERKEFVQGNLDRIKRQKKSVRKFREGTSEATTPDARTRRLSDALDTKAIDDFNKENSEPGDAPGITSGDVLRGNMESQKKHLLNAPAAATVVAGGAAAALLKKKKKQQQVEEPPLAKDFPEWGE